MDYLKEAVTRVNSSYEYIEKALPPVLEILKSEFEAGNRVNMITVDWSKKVRDEIFAFTYSALKYCHLYFTAGHGYSIRLELSVCVSDSPGTCVYLEKSIYLADLDSNTGKISKMLMDCSQCKDLPRYTKKTLTTLLNRYKENEKTIRILQEWSSNFKNEMGIMSEFVLKQAKQKETGS